MGAMALTAPAAECRSAADSSRAASVRDRHLDGAPVVAALTPGEHPADILVEGNGAVGRKQALAREHEHRRRLIRAGHDRVHRHTQRVVFSLISISNPHLRTGFGWTQ